MFEKHQLINTFLLLFVLSFFSQLARADGSEEKAKQLFSENKFEEALPNFKELVASYPADAFLNYYYGVCLTETNNYSQETKKILLRASLGDVPLLVYFYIGKNYHAQNDFSTAISYYNRFVIKAKNKEAKELGIKNLIELCEKEENPFVSEELSDEIETAFIAPQHTTNNGKSDSAQYKSDNTIQVIEKEPGVGEGILVEARETSTNYFSQQSNEIDTIQEMNAEEGVPESLKNTIIQFILTAEIQYYKIDQFRDTEAKAHFIEAWVKSNQLMKNLKRTENLRNEYDRVVTIDAKQMIAEKVLALERENLILKSEVDDNYIRSRDLELNSWNTASPNEIVRLKVQNDSILNSLKPKVVEPKIEEKPVPIIKDTVKVIEEKKLDVITYRIQIGAYSKGLPEYVDRLYKKMAMLRRIDHYTDDRGVVVYTVGEVSNFKDAVKLQTQIRQEGVKDAFVVAYKNGKRITLSEAKAITEK